MTDLTPYAKPTLLDRMILGHFGLADAKTRRAIFPIDEIDYDILLWRVGFLPTPSPGNPDYSLYPFPDEPRRSISQRYSDNLNL